VNTEPAVVPKTKQEVPEIAWHPVDRIEPRAAQKGRPRRTRTLDADSKNHSGRRTQRPSPWHPARTMPAQKVSP
jgi:hypothetical protein